MLRRASLSLVLAVVVGLVVIAPAQADGATTKAGPLPLVQGLRIENVCPFPVDWTDRGGRMLTTRFDRTGRVVSETISGTSTVVLTNLDTRLSVSFDIEELTTIVHHRDGTVTMLQLGSSGIALEPGTSINDPSLVWYGGAVLSRGTLDRTFLFADVTRQRRVGIEGDICEMLVSGLKTRH